MNRVADCRALLLTLALLIGANVSAQNCIAEREPNDTPPQANPLVGASCASGTLADQDQDAFVWTLSEEDSRTTWQFELASVRGELTKLDVFRVAFTEDGKGVLHYDSLMQLATPDGRTVTAEPRFFAPGTYVLGLSVSGGEGPYTVAFLPGEPIRHFRTDGADLGAVLETTAGFHEVGYLATQRLYDWNIPPELADQMWYLELTSAVAETLELVVISPDGSVLTSMTAADGSASVSSLGVEAGTYRLQVSSASGNLAPFSLLAAPQGVATAGREIEPNDSTAQANALHPDEELRGTVSTGGDIDHFRFVVTEEHADRLLELETGADEQLETCLLDAWNASLQCRTGGRLPDLHLAPGEYGLRLRALNSGGDVSYALLLRDAGEVDPLRPTEPNDRSDLAFPLPEGLGVRGELYGNEADYFSVHIAGEPQLWRAQVNGAGVTELAQMDAAGQQVARVRGSGNLRLDNAYLLPGTHYFSVRGADSTYTLRLLPLGPATAVDSAATSETAPQENRPAGLPEREPNDSTTSAELLRFGEPRVGLLTTSEDSDHFRFTLPAAQHVRLTVTPPAEGGMVAALSWGSESLGRAHPGEGGFIGGEAWLPAGEYYLRLQAEVPSEGWYQVQLEPLDPFLVPPGADSGYPDWPGRQAGSPYSPPETNVALKLRSAAEEEVAAHWPYGQRLELELLMSNGGSAALDLALDWHASDERWHVELPESVTVAGGEDRTILIPVAIAPDTPAAPVVLTVRASGTAGSQSTADISFTPDSMASPVGSHIWYAVPQALLGGLDAAWSSLGAEVISSSQEEKTLSDRFGVPLLLTDMAPLHHDHMRYRMHDWVAQETGLSEYPLTVRLAGSEPVELAGFLLNPTATDNPARSLRDFAVSVSLDGQQFTEVYRGALSPTQAEQAFVLPEPVAARYVRLHLLANHQPSIEPHLADMFLGTFKAVTTRDSARVLLGGSGLNIANPGVGGQMVWSAPASIAGSRSMLLPDGHIQTVRADHEQDSFTWVTGFHHHRAAQIERIHWLEHGEAANTLETVELSVALDSPVGPWRPLGSWNLGTGGATFELEEPVWARYVRFTATGLTPRDTYQLPDAISIMERTPDADYGSVAGEWGHYGRLGPYEQAHGQLEPTKAVARSNDSRGTATEIAPGELLRGTVELGEQEAWYRVTVPAGQNHLSVKLRGLPHRGFDYELTDAAGRAVQTLEEATSTEIVVSASVAPGDYLLRVYEPPRSVVITWDTSGSVAASLPVIYKALERFAENISPGVEDVNLLPFDSPFLLRDWSGDPLRVLEAIQAHPSSPSSSSGETALLRATEALAARPGKKAIILLTDGAINREEALWAALAEVRPHIFASSISSAGDLGPDAPQEQDRMQSYANVNGGHYEYVHAQGDFDVSFRRAATWLRRPSNYTVSVETDLRWAKASAWAVPELQRAADHGLIPDALAGADLTGPITRAEFAAVAVKVYEALTGEEAVPATVNPFTDTNDAEVLKAFNTELAVGISPTEFAPDRLLNREQAATILTRVFKKVNLPGWTWASDAEFPLEFDAPEPFADHERISDWARESVYFMAAHGIITGTGNSEFTPRAVTPEEQALGYANATREQALLLAVRLVEKREPPTVPRTP